MNRYTTHRSTTRFRPAGPIVLLAAACALGCSGSGMAQQDTGDRIRAMQLEAIERGTASWAHWGTNPEKYTGWTNHSNRLIPVYTFGISLDAFKGAASPYRDGDRLTRLYGQLPHNTLNPAAEYFDQTDIYRLQKAAIESGKKYIILMIFDGMDWQTTEAAAIYRNGRVAYTGGRGNGLAFQDYSAAPTDFGYMVTSPWTTNADYDVNAQIVTKVDGLAGGYDPQLGGATPWSVPGSYSYLISQDRGKSHAFTDSASSATSMTCGIKTYNAAVNFDANGKPTVPIAREMQKQGWSVGVVTSVPVSHATPAAAYSNNVTRNDYQDLSRDLIGLPSAANRSPLPGVDVLLGGGWGEKQTDGQAIKSLMDKQGTNFEPGNTYLADNDLAKIDVRNGGKYRVAQRTAGKAGREVLMNAATEAAKNNQRLLGFFGTVDGHLPYATADGDFRPTRGQKSIDVYQPADITENPTLADLTTAALQVLQGNENGFWLMVEAGDVDWANHNNNIDDSIGAVFSGDDAFRAICEWAESRQCWDETAVIVTADHGHLLVIDRPAALGFDTPASQGSSD